MRDRTLSLMLMSDLQSSRPSFRELGRVDPFDRIEFVRSGVPAQALALLATHMGVPREVMFGWVGIASATAKRRIFHEEALTVDEGDRVLNLLSLLGLVQSIVGESGNDAGFDAGRWLADWLKQPNASLGGVPPEDLLDTAEGRELVRNRVGQMQSGAYA